MGGGGQQTAGEGGSGRSRRDGDERQDDEVEGGVKRSGSTERGDGEVVLRRAAADKPPGPHRAVRLWDLGRRGPPPGRWCHRGTALLCVPTRQQVSPVCHCGTALSWDHKTPRSLMRVGGALR